MHKPALFYDIALKHLDSPYGGWHESADYFCWSGRFAVTDKPLTVWEKVEGGVIKLPDKPVLMHIIPAGRPHHIEHLFGYWHSCDADKFFIRKVDGEQVYYVLVVGGTKALHRRDTIAWCCPQCGTEIDHHVVEGGAPKWNEFLVRQLDLVRRFNENESLRRCSSCGHVHPLCYGLRPEDDWALEREMRAIW